MRNVARVLNTRRFRCNGTQAGAAAPDKLSDVPPGALLSLSTIDPNIKAAYGVQTEPESSVNLAAGFGLGRLLHTRGIHIIMQRNLNVPTLTASQGSH
jgi:hypothetical protein